MSPLPGLHVVFVDNFDSFTFNLVDEFARRGATVEVWRNTATPEHLLARAAASHRPPLIVLSPGPGAPADAGCCVELIRQTAGKVPIFGVCLGHQAMIEAFGGIVTGAGVILHGRSSAVVHQGDPIFDGIDSPFTVGRYHSLASHDVPADLVNLAQTDSIVMAVKHRVHPVLGIQFHPESVLTPSGGILIENVIRWAARAGAR